ncbi:prefoldin 5 [Actinidia rufa]|uniref:Prefoldin 5 n=1 Tax=Actinidia rufa TaxID=165716 RepID=A0A7J0DPD7_9ERIC|nr:prefoldin 5 [Actinidia rufa]
MASKGSGEEQPIWKSMSSKTASPTSAPPPLASTSPPTPSTTSPSVPKERKCSCLLQLLCTFPERSMIPIKSSLMLAPDISSRKTMVEGKDYCERKINLLKSNYDQLLEV